MKLYWTVPAVSLLACVLVVFYAAIAEGGKRMRVCSLTYLDQGARSAFTIGWVGFYSPSAHSDGLLFDEETELALQASPTGHSVSISPMRGSSGSVPLTITFSEPISGSPPKPAPGATPPSNTYTVQVKLFRLQQAGRRLSLRRAQLCRQILFQFTFSFFGSDKRASTTKPAPGATPPTAGFSRYTRVPIHRLWDADEQAVGSIDWTDGQRWSGEWIKPRIPLHFKFRKIQERTERIDLKRNGGKLKAVNRLGADVKAFWYADHDGKLYQASDIRNGAEAVLTETKSVQIGGKTLRQLYISQDWVPEIEAVKASPAAYLQPGRYIAELEENVFVEKAMKGAKMKPSTFLVVGDSTPE